MDLFTTLLNINNVQNDQILFVEKPWTPESQVTVLHVSFVKNPLAKNFQFFLAVKELKHLVLQFETRNVCLIELCYLIIEHVLEKNKIIQHL